MLYRIIGYTLLSLSTLFLIIDALTHALPISPSFYLMLGAGGVFLGIGTYKEEEGRFKRRGVGQCLLGVLFLIIGILRFLYR